MAESSKDTPPVVPAKDTVGDRLIQIERYLPAGFPQLLLSGTSLSNSTRIQTEGIAMGTLSSYLHDCLDDRFFRSTDGRLIVAQYTPETYYADLSGEFPGYQFYRIKPGTGPEREIIYDNVDTDNRQHSNSYRTRNYTDPHQMGSLALSEEQRYYFRQATELFYGGICGDFSDKDYSQVSAMLQKYEISDLEFVSGRCEITGPMQLEFGLYLKSDEGDYRTVLRQKHIANILGLQTTDFASLDTLQQAVNQAYPDEEQLFVKLAQHLPGQLVWDWKNLPISDTDVTTSIIRQLYQQTIVDRIKAIGVYEETPWESLILQGRSIEGLNQLKQEKGIS